MTPEEFLKILDRAAALKTAFRHCETAPGRKESVADHSWRIALMAMLLSGEPEFKACDMDRVIRMCLIHDLGEAFTGDIPTFVKTSADAGTEAELYTGWVQGFSEPQRSEWLSLLAEMSTLSTREAKLYKALDKMEAVISHNESDMRTWLPLEYDLQLNYGRENVQFSDYMKSLKRSVDRQTLEKIDTEGRNMQVRLYYDRRPEPLELRCIADPADRVKLVLYPYRAELYVNDVLSDEEWPCGNFLRLETEPAGRKIETVYAEKEEDGPSEEPAVLGTFRCAEGWMPGGGVFVGDCMPYTAGGRYHVLWLYDRHHHHSKWGKGAHQWAHISTEDLQTWQIHPMAVKIDDPEEGSICTGSYMENSGKAYLFYTVRTMDGSPAPIRRSVSPDGYHFRKDPDFSFTLSGKYTGDSARDPKVVKAEDGSFHMFVTTTERASGLGCLVHLISDDLDHWTEEEEPIYRSPDSNEPECSDYLHVGKYYYLIFSQYGKGQYLWSEEPFTGWKTPDDPYIPCESVPKAAVFNGRILFAGFHRIENYAGSMTFKEAFVREDGQLRF